MFTVGLFENSSLIVENKANSALYYSNVLRKLTIIALKKRWINIIITILCLSNLLIMKLKYLLK